MCRVYMGIGVFLGKDFVSRITECGQCDRRWSERRDRVVLRGSGESDFTVLAFLTGDALLDRKSVV